MDNNDKRFYEAIKMLYQLSFFEAMEKSNTDMDSFFKKRREKKVYIPAYKFFLTYREIKKMRKNNQDLLRITGGVEIIDRTNTQNT